jgi:hypothetical protein
VTNEKPIISAIDTSAMAIAARKAGQRRTSLPCSAPTATALGSHANQHRMPGIAQPQLAQGHCQPGHARYDRAFKLPQQFRHRPLRRTE